MRYETMFPDQIRDAIDRNLPVAMAAGVLEYHSEHLPPGVDTLLVQHALLELEKDLPLVLLPPFYYGAASYAVAPPERNGTVHVEADAIIPLARQLFANLLRIGFRNIHLVIHHQTENFTAGMPTDLALKFAARSEIFAFIDRQRGEGWWGSPDSASYYDDHAGGENPFNWIRIHPLMIAEAQARFPIDHAGKQETSLMMAFCPECVDMNRFSHEAWYARTATEANIDYGNAARRAILDGLRRALTGT